MAAFSYSDAQALKTNIKRMYARLDIVSTIGISHVDFLQLFVPYDHRKMFNEMALLAHHGSGRRASYTWSRDDETFDLAFTINDVPGSPSVPFPKNMVLQHDAGEPAERISSWLENGVHASRDFGRVMKVFEVLNEKISASVMHFYWPSIMAIAAEDDSTQHIVVKLRDLGNKPAKVALPFGMPRAVRKAAETVTASCLLARDIVADTTHPVAVHVRTGQTHNEPGIGNFYGLQ